MGNDLLNEHMAWTHKNIKDEFHCQTLCQAHNDCKFWTFGKKDGTYKGNCWLKSSNKATGRHRGRVENKGLTSGPKICGMSLNYYLNIDF